MTLRKTLLASATLALVSIAGAAAAAPMQSAMHPGLHNSPALTIQYQAPDWRNDRFDNNRNDRFDRRHVVSDRVILSNLRANNLRAVSNPRFVRGRLVVQAMGRFGRIVTVEFNPYTGRMIGVIRL